MAKRTTKADMILAAAQERMNEAERVRDVCRVELNTKQAIFEIHADLYDQLKRDLAPKPRSNGSGSVPKPKRASKTAADSKCWQCGEGPNGALHGTGYVDSHPFVKSNLAPSAKRKSSPASASQKDGVASLLADVASAMNASNAAGSE